MRRGNGEGSIYKDKRRGGYIAIITVGKDPRTGRPIRRQKSVRMRREAWAALNTLREKYRRGVVVDGGRVNLARYVKDYAETFKRPHVRENTWLNYIGLLKLAEESFGRMRLDELNPTTFQQIVNAVASQNTAHRLAVLVRAAVRQALAEGRITLDPTVGVRAPKGRRKKEVRVITREEAIRLAEAAAGQPPLRMAILLQYATGMRAEEVLGLTWDEVDFVRYRLRVVQVTNQVRRRVMIAPPKTQASRRTIPLPPALMRDLAAYRHWQERQRAELGERWNDSPDGGGVKGFVYTYDGNPVGIHSYAGAFRAAAKRAELDITPHGLRHTHATQLFAAGWAAKDVQARLGHTSVAMTLDIYTHYLPERAQEVARGIDALYPDTSDSRE